MPRAGIAMAWVEVSATLPLGWFFEGVIRTPAGVWQAMAASPQGEQVHAEGDNEIAALTRWREDWRLCGGARPGRAGDPIIRA